MGTNDDISREAMKDYLSKGWLTHDGMWFYNACRELGIETANRLNRAAIRSMAPLEVERSRKVLGIIGEAPATFDGLADFFVRGLELLLPSSVFSRFMISIPEKNLIRWEWKEGECFAYKGIKMTGFIDAYECGVIYRLECWMDALGIKYRVEPETGKCMMHHGGYCRGSFRFFFPDNG